MDLDNYYFMVRFKLSEDFSNVLTKGPWVVFCHYLVVQPWNTRFSIDECYSKHMTAWICLPGLPSKLIKIDMNTMFTSRGCFAILIVVVDLSRLLVSKVNVENFIQRVEYKSLMMIYYSYGRMRSGSTRFDVLVNLDRDKDNYVEISKSNLGPTNGQSFCTGSTTVRANLALNGRSKGNGLMGNLYIDLNYSHFRSWYVGRGSHPMRNKVLRGQQSSVFSTRWSNGVIRIRV
ncbi:hypothetical protein J1N35_021040 [Gossypium stocksii]|uniref:DUF4283 domain-containing protein n=1 Tax=Gossypium stocksii TaxID=47602 RepID=A0A9D4A221_9ROSI|nr:hypothetical protein J1N35_021040 [Gossypium stocksii]